MVSPGGRLPRGILQAVSATPWAHIGRDHPSSMDIASRHGRKSHHLDADFAMVGRERAKRALY